MMLLLAAIPVLFWDGAADTAPALREAGIERVAVAPARAGGWKGIPGIQAEAVDLAKAVKLSAPGVNYRMNEATASRAPWLVANGWKIIRRPDGKFYYDAPGRESALAAAEAFAYGADAVVRTGTAGLKALGEMQAFLRTIPAADLPPVADIGYVDDGSAVSGEVMNLLVRNNLLFRVVRAPDPRLTINVQPGSREYPLDEARNPSVFAHLVRANLTDEKRSVRIYGSTVVVARLTESVGRARLHLLNYAGANQKVEGLRVRILGRFSGRRLWSAGDKNAELMDVTTDGEATEFTLRELGTYAVIDLSR